MIARAEARSATRLAIIGAGRAGRRFALHCLAHQQTITLEDVMPANLRSAAAELAFLEMPHTAGVILATSVEDAVREADVVVDFVPDELESKLEIFSLIDRMAPPRTILLTPSDALSIADLASCTYRSDRCFALRGFAAALAGDGLTTDQGRPKSLDAELTLVHPDVADPGAQACVEHLLRSLQLAYTVALDTQPSLLAGR